jgi:hypothetical protein
VSATHLFRHLHPWRSGPLAVALLLTAGAAASCTDDSSSGGDGTPDAGTPDSAATGGSSGSGGSSPGGAAGGPATGGTGDAGDPGDPILDRPPRATYACNVADALAPLGTLQWWGKSLATSAGQYVVGRGQYQSSMGADPRVQFSTLGFDGTLGSAVTLGTTGITSMDPVLAESGGDFGAAWVEGDYGGAQTLRFAVVQPDGQIAVGPVTVGGTGSASVSGPALVATASGFATAWIEGDNLLRFAQLDASGATVGAAVTLVDRGTSLSSARLVAVGDGFAAAVSSFEGTAWEALYLAIDATGAPLGSPTSLGAGTDQAALLARGTNEVLVAWSRSHGDYSSNAINVELTRFDGAGNQTAPVYSLQAPVTDEENVWPSLVDVNGDVAVTWSKGGIIYICAGCMPDDRIEFVIVDGDDLVPLSPVVEFSNTASAAGLMRSVTARNGLDFLVVADITYHVSSEPASAGIRCTQ